jgi:chromosome segregation ATPase
MKISFVIILIMIISYIKCSFLQLEQLLASNQDEMDSDDMVYKMKEYFDNYAIKLKQSTKTFDKIVLPQEIVYTDKFDLDDLNRKSKTFVSDSSTAQEKDLKILREFKQIAEEKNIDLETKNKILNTRISISSTEKNKMNADLNSKISKKQEDETDLNRIKVNGNKLADENLRIIKEIKNVLQNYTHNYEKLKLNQKTFEDEFSLINKLDNVRSELFKTKIETEFYKDQNQTNTAFISSAKNLSKIFESEINSIRVKIQNIQLGIDNKTELIQNKKKKLEENFESFQNLNRTITKLHSMQDEYSTILREVEENINYLQSKKTVLAENINQNKRQTQSGIIEKTLSQLEKELEKYNIDKLALNPSRIAINEINKRTKNLLMKENLIFKKNKIKI